MRGLKLNPQEEVEVNASIREQVIMPAGRMISLSRDKIRGLDAEVEAPNPPEALSMRNQEMRLFNSLSVNKMSILFNLPMVTDTFLLMKSLKKALTTH